MSAFTGDNVIQRVFDSNKKWAEDVAKSKPDFFDTSSKGQTPKLLWFGCADSRVPETVLSAFAPGDIFVHRNIANQFRPDDASANSVLQYAVENVGVEHVAVVGHTFCGGANACYDGACGRLPIDSKSVLAGFLGPFVDLAKSLKVDEESEEGRPAKVLELTEENVRVQVANLAQSDVVTRAWSAGKNVTLHGWIYEIESGLLKDLAVSQGPRAGK